jgi:hypothetical protein
MKMMKRKNLMLTSPRNFKNFNSNRRGLVTRHSRRDANKSIFNSKRMRMTSRIKREKKMKR